MLATKAILPLALAAIASAQGQFCQPENSAAVLAALQEVDKYTVSSGEAAAAFTLNNTATTDALTLQNLLLRSAWQDVVYYGTSSSGFYTESGAQTIIDFINDSLFPHTRDADTIYVNKRDIFSEGGFIDFINPGILKLRSAVDAASAAVQAKTRAKQLRDITEAFTSIEENYAVTQEFQQFGAAGAPASSASSGTGCPGTPATQPGTGTGTGSDLGSGSNGSGGFGGYGGYGRGRGARYNRQ